MTAATSSKNMAAASERERYSYRQSEVRRRFCWKRDKHINVLRRELWQTGRN